MLWNYHYVSSSKLTTLTIVWFESFLSLYLIFALAPQSVAYGKLFSNNEGWSGQPLSVTRAVSD